jgi:hypothetical protein
MAYDAKDTLTYPNTNSVFNNTETSTAFNRTGVALSTMVIVKVGDYPVGAIQKIDITETRTIKMFSEVGTDGAIDSAPTSSTVHSGSCERLRYDRIRIFEAFGCGFVHLKSMRIPITIDIIDRYTATSNETAEGSIITTLENVWFKDIKYGYSQDNWQVSDNVSFDFETIYSRIGGNSSAASGRDRLKLRNDKYETQADMGSRRGAMDLPGLITSAYIK